MRHVRRLLTSTFIIGALTCVFALGTASATAAPALTGVSGPVVTGPAATGSVVTGQIAAAPAVDAPNPPRSPATPGSTETGGISIDVEGGAGGRSQSVTIIVLLTVLSIAPSILLLMTSFTKIIIVLALTRQAIGTPTIPPNQVIAGIALFLSLFVMGPVIGQVNDAAIQPYMQEKMTMSQALKAGEGPLRTFMLRQTGKEELQTMINISRSPQPANPEDVEITTLIPAFVLSELKTAFIIGFVIFVPFLVIDLVVASILMAMGMMMLPPVMISMPFKILLFVMVDGWSLITTALVSSYVGTT